MIRIAALNDSTSESDSDDGQSFAVGTKEAEESEAYMLYNKALREDIHKAEDAFEQLLCHGFIREAAKLVENETEGAIHPGLQLLYSIYKNLAVMSLQKGDHKTAMEWYIEAVKVDQTEVTVWYKIGTIALKLHNYQLARLGFEQGLQCNPKHWPCLDNVITVLYTINDYFYCLHYISKALENDHQYTKGIAFRNQILKEQPSLRQYTSEMFVNCDQSINLTEVDKEEIDEYLNEALEMRQKRREMAEEPPKRPIKLPLPIKSFTWKSVGESLLSLYSKIKKSDPPMSMGLRVDLSDHVTDKMADVSPQDNKSEENMDVDKSTEESSTTNPTTSIATANTSDNRDVTTKTEGDNVVVSEQEPMDITVSSSSPVSVTLTTTTTALILSPVVTVQDRFTSGSTTASPTVAPSVTSALHDHSGLASSDFDNRKGPQKRKRGPTLDDQFGKRRSARVRNTFKSREEEKVNFQELLLNFLPSSLKQVSEDEDMDLVSSVISESHMPRETNLASKTDHSSNGSEVAVMLVDTEEEEVKKFLQSEQENGGCLCLMQQYVLCLGAKYNRVWPRDLIPVFLRVYTQVRKHFDLPCLYSKDDTDEYLLSLGKCCLLCVELQLDRWMMKNVKPGNSPRSSGHSPGSQILHSSDLPAHNEDDIEYITGLTSYCDVLADFWHEHCIRVYWMKAKFYMAQGQTEDALYCFQMAKKYLELANDQKKGIRLWNCMVDNVITIEQVESQQESLQRSQSLETAQNLYMSGDYQKVADFLLKAFSQPQQKDRVTANTEASTGVPERLEQLLLLQECLLKLQNYQRGLYWGEIAFEEALKGYKKATTSALKDEWSKCLTQIWTLLLKILEKDGSALQGLPSSSLVRLSQNLVFVIDTMMSVPDIATDMPIGSVLPFMLLYRVINHEEQRFRSLQKLDGSGAGDMENAMPSSLMLLNMAHDYLGRHSWCTKSSGALLLFFMKVVKKEMDEHSKFTDEFKQAYEQCVYCMYGHPNKKAKARHLVDHNAPQIELKWKEANEIFEYFKPKTVPEFDSFKTDTVSAELEFLLKRIAQLVPENEKPSLVMESVQEYIDGNTNVAPYIAKDNFSTISKELYYLLGDYYFKNQEHAKAIKFYMYDICINPQRLDSWAGLALARMSQLEQKLNSTELRMDIPIHKKSIAALRCFGHSVEIEDASGKLWMEYGSLSYQLHSHSSRQLKYHQEKLEELGKEFLDEDLIQIARDYRQEMLQSAFNCYKNASECEDEESEEWLTQYMMGKCLEKMKKTPKDYLEHYKLASIALHEENATYPKKITYAYTAHTSPRLAVEALEMFYRLHVSILKILLKTDSSSDLRLYKTFIEEAANTPFAQGKEKKDENKDSSSLTVDDGTSMQRKSKSTTSQQDHTYSKQKNSSNMMELSLNENSSDVQNADASKTIQIKLATDSADSLEEKAGNSAENSCSSSEYFPSAESEASSGSNEGLVKDVEEPFISKGLMSEVSSSQEISSNQMLASSSVMELSAEVLDNESPQSSSSNPVIQLIVKASAPKQSSTSITVSSGKTPEDSNDQEESSLHKQTSTGFVVQEDVSVSTSPSVIEDEDGNITVKAKIENIEPEMSVIPPLSGVKKPSKDATSSESGKYDGNVIEIFSSPEPVASSSDEADLHSLSKADQSGDSVVGRADQSGDSVAGSRQVEDMDVNTYSRKNTPEAAKLSQPLTTTVTSQSDMLPDTTDNKDTTVKTEKEEEKKEKVGVLADSSASVMEVECSGHDEKPVLITSKGEIDPVKEKKSGDETCKEDERATDLTLTNREGQSSQTSQKEDNTGNVETTGPEPLDTKENSPLDITEKDTDKVDNSGNSSTNKDHNNPQKNVEPTDKEKQSSDGAQSAEEIDMEDVFKKVDAVLSQNINEKKLVTTESNVPKVNVETDSVKSQRAVINQKSDTVQDNTERNKTNVTTEGKESKELPDTKNSDEKICGDKVKKDLIEKCMAALHLCLSRFPTHYKSLYRLAYVYFNSPYHKNLPFAKDLLLGNVRWQSLSHMPAPGLFSERKVANFFQGTWRLPIGEVERSGSFATHLNKAVLLLLKILREQTDVSLLYHIHLQLNRSPDAGKKYLRDGERLHFALLAFDYSLDAIKSRISVVRGMTDKEKALKFLMETYRIWNYATSKQKSHLQRVNNLFAATFKAAMKGEANPDRPLLEQAIKFCQSRQQQFSSFRQHHASGGKSNLDSNTSRDGSQSDSSFFSPERPLSHPASVSSPVLTSRPSSPMKTNFSKSSWSPSTGMSPVKSNASSQNSNLSPLVTKSATSSHPLRQIEKSSTGAKSGEISASLLLASMISANLKSSEKELTENKETSIIKSQKVAQSGVVKGVVAQSGVVKGVVPQSGAVKSVFPQSGVAKGVAPQSGVVKGVFPQSGVAKGVVPQSGVAKGVVPQSGAVKGVVAQSGAVKGVPSHHQIKGSANSPQKQIKSNFSSDAPTPPQKTPPTPVLDKTFNNGKTSTPPSEKMNKQKLSLSLNKPKPAPVVSLDVIEISSSSDEEMVEPSTVATKPNSDKTDNTKAVDSVTKCPSDSGSGVVILEESMRSDKEKQIPDQNISATKTVEKKNSDKSATKDNKVSEQTVTTKVMETEESSNPGSVDEGPSSFLDPATGLFVTDSDSQNSLYVANPENLSFDINEMMDVDN